MTTRWIRAPRSTLPSIETLSSQDDRLAQNWGTFDRSGCRVLPVAHRGTGVQCHAVHGPSPVISPAARRNGLSSPRGALRHLWCLYALPSGDSSVITRCLVIVLWVHTEPGYLYFKRSVHTSIRSIRTYCQSRTVFWPDAAVLTCWSYCTTVAGGKLTMALATQAALPALQSASKIAGPGPVRVARAIVSKPEGWNAAALAAADAASLAAELAVVRAQARLACQR